MEACARALEFDKAARGAEDRVDDLLRWAPAQTLSVDGLDGAADADLSRALGGAAGEEGGDDMRAVARLREFDTDPDVPTGRERARGACRRATPHDDDTLAPSGGGLASFRSQLESSAWCTCVWPSVGCRTWALLRRILCQQGAAVSPVPTSQRARMKGQFRLTGRCGANVRMRDFRNASRPSRAGWKNLGAEF